MGRGEEQLDGEAAMAVLLERNEGEYGGRPQGVEGEWHCRDTLSWMGNTHLNTFESGNVL
jgi:hypothetical protein